MYIYLEPENKIQIDLEGKRGDTFIRNLTVLNEDQTNYDFTGYTAIMQIKEKEDDVISVIELTTENNRIILTEGLISLEIENIATKDIIPKNYVYDFELHYPDGRVITWFYGKFKFNNDITRTQ